MNNQKLMVDQKIFRQDVGRLSKQHFRTNVVKPMRLGSWDWTCPYWDWKCNSPTVITFREAMGYYGYAFARMLGQQWSITDNEQNSENNSFNLRIEWFMWWSGKQYITSAYCRCLWMDSVMTASGFYYFYYGRKSQTRLCNWDMEDLATPNFHAWLTLVLIRKVWNDHNLCWTGLNSCQFNRKSSHKSNAR